MIKRALYLLAVYGTVLCIVVYAYNQHAPLSKLSPELPLSQPISSHAHSIAQSITAGGMIEPFGQIISIGTPYSEIVTHIYVEVGDYVKKDTPLFTLNTQQLEASLVTAQEKVALACAELNNVSATFSYFQGLKNKNAVSKREYSQAYYAKQSAQKALAVSIAAMREIEISIMRSTVCAPCDGVVLQQNTFVGDAVNTNAFDKIPIMVFGDMRVMQIRINIEENDAWRYMPGMCAKALVKGNRAISIPLMFHHVEPLMVQKTRAVGINTRKVDGRVLQVVYTFDKKDYPVYIGQMLDVYLDTCLTTPDTATDTTMGTTDSIGA